MFMKTIDTYHFVKSEDLNHHGTLFAGRAAEWFVESGLMSTSAVVPVEQVVLRKIESMNFLRPVPLGKVLHMEGTIVYAGRTSLVSHIEGSTEEGVCLEGFITYVNLGEDRRPMAHGVTIEARSEEERGLQEKARQLRT